MGVSPREAVGWTREPRSGGMGEERGLAARCCRPVRAWRFAGGRIPWADAPRLLTAAASRLSFLRGAAPILAAGYAGNAEWPHRLTLVALLPLPRSGCIAKTRVAGRPAHPGYWEPAPPFTPKALHKCEALPARNL